MRRIVLLLALVCIAGAAQAQIVFGPGDTVKIPLELMDSINNPAAVDSAADSVLVRVIKNMAANASGADTCYLHRGLMDASTNSLLHTTGNATTTLGFGSVPKRVQTFSFFATAYTLTNSATASGTYTIEVWTYDHSLGLITTRKIPFNYVYVGTSTMTYKDYADSLVIATRNTKAMTDSINAILDTLQVYDTRWDSTLAVFADANTLMKNRLLRIRDSVDVILDTLQNQDNWISSATNLTKALDSINAILDTLQVTDTRWDSTLAVFADANTLFKNRLLRVRDSIDAILDTLQLYDASGHLPVNAAKIGGTTQTGLDIGSYLPAIMDSVMLSNGYRAGQKAIFKVSANLDTLYIYSRDGTTLLFRTVFVHPGGSPGDPPDTSRSVGP